MDEFVSAQRATRTLWLVVVTALATSLGSGCVSFTASVQSQEKAIAAATQFTRYAFVDNDAERAHLKLSDEQAQEITQADLGALLASMHPSGRPGMGSLRAREIELAAGRTPLIAIYFESTSGSEAFYYQVVVQGGASAGYRVVGFRRGAGPFPPSNRQPI